MQHLISWRLTEVKLNAHNYRKSNQISTFFYCKYAAVITFRPCFGRYQTPYFWNRIHN